MSCERSAATRALKMPSDLTEQAGLSTKNALVLDDLPEVDYPPDPKDNPILATAIAGQAQYIVSGDKRDMLELTHVEGIPIVTARDFVSLFMRVGP